MFASIDSQALVPVLPLDLGKRGPGQASAPHNLEGSTLTLLRLCLFLWGEEPAGPREHAHQSPCPPSPFLDQTLDTEDLCSLLKRPEPASGDAWTSSPEPFLLSMD